MAKLDSLIVDLQVNTAALRKGLDDAMGMFAKLGKSVEHASKEIHELTEMKAVEWGKEIVESFAEFVQGGAEAAEMAGKLAQSVGMPVEDFSRLSYAANLSHVSTEDFAKSLEKLDKNLAEAGSGSAKQVALFGALGVAVKDSAGNVRDTESVLGDLADVFSHMKDGADKTALSMEVFGKSGAALIPFLNEGRDGLEEMEAEADRLGITINSRTAAAATAFEDDLKKLKLAGQSVAAHVAGELTPMLTQLTHQLLESKSGTDLLKDAVSFLAGAFKVLVSAGIIVKGIFEVIGKELAGLAATVVHLVQGDFRGALRTYADMGGELEKEVKGDLAALSAVWGDHTNTVESEAGKQTKAVTKSGTAIMADFKAREKAPELFKQGMEALTKVLEEYGKKIAEISDGGKDPLAEITQRLNSGDLAKDLAKIGDKADEMRKKILAAAAALQKLEVGNLKVELNFQNKLAGNATDFAVDQRKSAFNTAGNATSTFQAQTEGFKDFDAAITRYADSVKEKAQWEEQAKVAAKKGDVEAYQGALLFAQSADEAAQKADIAAKAFEGMASQGSNFVNGLKVLGSAFTSKLGALGQTIDDAVKGFQQGGIWGALFALIMDLLSMMDGWKDIQAIAQGALKTALKDMSKGLNSVISGLKPLMGAIESIAQAVHGVLGPVLTLVGTILKGIAPILEVLGVSLKVVGGTLGPLIQIIGGILDPIFKLLAMTLSPLVILFMYLKVAVDGVALGFNMAINELEKWIKKNTGIDVGNNEGGVADAQLAFDTDKAAADKFGQDFIDHPFDALNNLAQDDADGLKDLGDQTDKTTRSMASMTQQLTNVPAGIRVALNRFNATSPVMTGAAGGATGNGPSIHINNVVVQAGDMFRLYEQLKKVHERQKYQGGGPPPH